MPDHTQNLSLKCNDDLFKISFRIQNNNSMPDEFPDV